MTWLGVVQNTIALELSLAHVSDDTSSSEHQLAVQAKHSYSPHAPDRQAPVISWLSFTMLSVASALLLAAARPSAYTQATQ